MAGETITKRIVDLCKDLPARRIVEIGSLNINGEIRQEFPQAFSYLGIDIVPGPGVDIVADGSIWLPELPADLVLCSGVLEHTAKAEAIVRNAYRMLRPGGTAVILTTCRMRPHSAVTGEYLTPPYREYYRNVQGHELLNWMGDFQEAMVWRERRYLFGVGKRLDKRIDFS